MTVIQKLSKLARFDKSAKLLLLHDNIGWQAVPDSRDTTEKGLLRTGQSSRNISRSEGKIVVGTSSTVQDWYW